MGEYGRAAPDSAQYEIGTSTAEVRSSVSIDRQGAPNGCREWPTFSIHNPNFVKKGDSRLIFFELYTTLHGRTRPNLGLRRVALPGWLRGANSTREMRALHAWGLN